LPPPWPSGANAVDGVLDQVEDLTDADCHAAFEKMHAAFLDAVKRKDLQALTALVAPTFLWTVGDTPADDLDLGRDSIHNFKVAFGFRGLGKDVDGGVDNGPYWDVLTSFADDATYYAATDSGNLVCGPIAAEVADDRIFEQAQKKIETANEPVEWYFTLSDTAVAKAPGDTGAPVAKVGIVALPLLSFYPPEKEGAPPPPPTHFEVLLPSGRTGWVPVAAVRPLAADHLCYARAATGATQSAISKQPSDSFSCAKTSCRRGSTQRSASSFATGRTNIHNLRTSSGPSTA
jgi:hypothetical protein